MPLQNLLKLFLAENSLARIEVAAAINYWLRLLNFTSVV